MFDVGKKKSLKSIRLFLTAIFRIKLSLLSITRAILRNLNHYLTCREQNKKRQTIFEILF